ncbi:hypothetical protein THF5H11_20705 [Vibrio jasicida]|uniref:hypothetical protein n=1 Tax=Vibrio jasicida TaxID=766224 RepID=UPI002894EEE0|nr:hypothetical protein THF5H11_20705 [Vibrio jasicida]
MNERLQKAQARHEELVADLTEKQNANIELQIRKLTIDNERERKHLDRIEKYWWYRLATRPIGVAAFMVSSVTIVLLFVI